MAQGLEHPLNLRIFLAVVAMIILSVLAFVLLDGVASVVAFVLIVAAWAAAIRLLASRFAKRNAEPS